MTTPMRGAGESDEIGTLQIWSGRGRLAVRVRKHLFVLACTK
jgi:hypothetical protein